ncbi:MAG: hypothetical protein AAGA48_37040 [Myxococcota bacterium]
MTNLRALLPAIGVVVSCSGPEPIDETAFAHQCVTVTADGRPLVRDGEDGFRFSRDGEPARLHLAPADLGTYLLYDRDGGYLVAEEAGRLLRQTTLESDATLIDDAFVSGAEWDVEPDVRRPDRPQLRNRRTGRLLGRQGLLDAEATRGPRIRLEAVEGCTAPPELSLDAEGTVGRTTFDDGDLFGIVDTHAHIMSNWGFGGGGIYHGAPFHRLGVAHALPDCERSHGENGRKDFIGAAFDAGGADGIDVEQVLGGLLAGELPEDNHATAGYPDFTEWPDAVRRSTHQTEYHRWIERAYLAGLRLIVQHATTNAVLCELSTGAGNLPRRYSCGDMVSVDRQIDEMYAMERYLDAQAGGVGEGWFRIVTSPAEARDVIRSGKLAVILGIETSDLFQCRLVPRDGGPLCDEAWVLEQLELYYKRGVRAIFPVHKYDNQFSAGDGDRNFIELGNFLNSGHFSNFVTGDCPDVPSVFDEGPVVFGGLNQPRDDYFAPPPNDLSGFADDPLGVSLPFFARLTEPALDGDYCQQAGLTPLGRFLIEQLMDRGMIIEIDHLPRRSYAQTVALLDEAEYPAAGTHGNTNNGQLYVHGGVSKTSIRRCQDAENAGALLGSLRNRLRQIEAAGGYLAEGFGFDLNGFAGARGGRFAEGACPTPQSNPVTYPFTAWGDEGVTFTEPFVGTRRVDFNEEGFVHIGMMPELLEDARQDAVNESDLEPLFRSAEGYLRMWERALSISEMR